MPENKLKKFNFGIGQYFIITLLIVASFLIGSLYTKVQYLEKSNNQPQQATNAQDQAQQPAAASLDTVKSVFNKALIKFGDDKSKLVILEVSDPSCPYCHIAAGNNPELNKQAGDRFTLVSDGGTYIAPVSEFEKLVKDNKASYALIYTPGHGAGEMGTIAMYCAFDEGRFWEVHNKIFTNEGYELLNNTIKNDRSKSQELSDFLKNEIDSKYLKDCIDSQKYDSRLSEETQLASSVGITGTPGFYLNDTQFAGAYSYADMESVVSEALK